LSPCWQPPHLQAASRRLTAEPLCRPVLSRPSITSTASAMAKLIRKLVHNLRKRYRNSLSRAFSFRTVLSEVIGVFGFVLVGCGAATLVTAPDSFNGGNTQRMISSSIVGFAFGFGIFFMISATAHNNSDQLNPAVSIALMACGSCPLLQGFVNIAGQVLGAIIACGLLKAMLPSSFQDVSLLGANNVPPGSGVGKAFLSAHLAALRQLLPCCSMANAASDNCCQLLPRCSVAVPVH
jgi:Major intrinsic protein